MVNLDMIEKLRKDKSTKEKDLKAAEDELKKILAPQNIKSIITFRQTIFFLSLPSFMSL